MKRLSTALPLAIVVIILGYFVFKIVGPYINPCESMAQETSTSLSANLQFIQSNASFTLNENQLNDLSDRTEQMAYNLKSCCIGGTRNLFKENESFAKCLSEANKYNNRLERAINYINLAEAARESGDEQNAEENARRVNAVLGYTEQVERA